MSNYGIAGSPYRSLITFDRCFFTVIEPSSGPIGSLIVTKTDSSGNVLWSNEINYNNAYFFLLNGITQAVDSGYLILVNVRLTGAQHANQTVFKLDKAGNFLWTYSYTSTGSNYANSIIRNTDNGFMLAGGGFGSDAIIKCDANGGIVWQKQFVNVGFSVAFGIASHDYYHFVVTGYHHDNLIFYEIDISGNFYWHSEVSFPNTGIGAWAFKPCLDGGYVAAGQVKYIPSHGSDAFLSKIDSTGNLQWLKIYSSGNSALAYDADELSDSSILIGGSGDTLIWRGLIVKTDMNGNLQFAKGDTVNNGGWFSVTAYSPWTVLLTGRSNLTYMALTDTSCLSLCNVSLFPVQEFTPVCTDSFIVYTPIDLTYVLDSLTIAYTVHSLIRTPLCSTTSINEIPILDEIKIYPNPFSDELNIAVNNSELSEIIIFDIASRIIMQQKFSKSLSLNTKQFAKGIYIYELRNKNGIIKKGKVAKE